MHKENERRSRLEYEKIMPENGGRTSFIENERRKKLNPKRRLLQESKKKSIVKKRRILIESDRTMRLTDGKKAADETDRCA